jgi:nucleoside 2-deoxyribosyltransferase
MNVFRYDTPVERVKESKYSVFLAGPTVRGHQQHLQPSWRFEAIEHFHKAGFCGDLIVPEFPDKAESDKGKEWIPLWEYEGLKHAKRILFWVPRTRELIGLTTNWELGFWMGQNISKISYGRPDGAYRTDYLDIMYRAIAPKRSIFISLKDQCEFEAQKIKDYQESDEMCDEYNEQFILP